MFPSFFGSGSPSSLPCISRLLVSMPTTRSRKRTGSASSDSGLPNSLPSPLGLGVAINPRPLPEEDQDPFLEGGALASLRLDSASLSCCNPRGCILGPIEHGLATPTTQEVVRMICSNDKCPYSPFMHLECFENFEEQILSCLRGMSRAKSWSEKQRRQNLWTKKGYDLIFKFCGCQCGKGNLRKDLNHVLPDPPLPSLPSSSSSSSVTIATDKSKKKRKKSSSLSSDRPSSTQAPPTHAPPTQSHHAPAQTRTRSRSQRNSDSVSSDNGLSNYMQPFAHRTDYSVFDRFLPRHLINGYHIKMEDDGYAAGDETRSFVLSSLAFHRTNTVSCVLCDELLNVYDRYPLLNGTFFLSPIQLHKSSLEVEGKGDDPVYMSAVCLACMVGLNSIKCLACGKQWNGICHQVGTLYTYDLFSATPCCPASVQCNKCCKPMLEVGKISLSFTSLSSIYECPFCSHRAYHFLKTIEARFRVEKRHFMEIK